MARDFKTNMKTLSRIVKDVRNDKFKDRRAMQLSSILRTKLFWNKGIDLSDTNIIIGDFTDKKGNIEYLNFSHLISDRFLPKNGIGVFISTKYYDSVYKVIETLYENTPAKPNYVYIITDGEYLQIGSAKDNVQKRLDILQDGNPIELKIAFKIKVENAVTLEKDLHKTFREYNIRGEWFKMDINLIIEEINKIKIHY